MGTVTVRFHNEQKARSFAEKNNGKFMICHSKESSKYKVQVKKKSESKAYNQCTSAELDRLCGDIPGLWEIPPSHNCFCYDADDF